MANYTVEISSNWTTEQTFEFMADMHNFIRWDPGIKNVTPISCETCGRLIEYSSTLNDKDSE